MKSRILFVTGHREDARAVTEMLRALPLAVEHVRTLKQARTRLLAKHFDVVLSESSLDDGNWLDVLDLTRDITSQPQLIVTDPNADTRFWAEALNRGAYDLIAQPFYESEVRRILHNACSRPAPAIARAAV
jgi:DNA-binding NtrC family response regulator